MDDRIDHTVAPSTMRPRPILEAPSAQRLHETIYTMEGSRHGSIRVGKANVLNVLVGVFGSQEALKLIKESYRRHHCIVVVVSGDLSLAPLPTGQLLSMMSKTFSKEK